MELQRLTPSLPGYDFSAADLENAGIDQQLIGKILMQARDGIIDPMTLLAAIIRGMKKANSYYTQVPFGLGTYQKQQLIGTDPKRNFLMVQNVGDGDLFVSFQPDDPKIVDFSTGADSQQVLNLYSLQCMGVVAGGNFFPDTTPINPITIFTLGVATQGVIIVGQ